MRYTKVERGASSGDGAEAARVLAFPEVYAAAMLSFSLDGLSRLISVHTMSLTIAVSAADTTLPNRGIIRASVKTVY